MQLYRLINRQVRDNAIKAILEAPDDWYVEIKPPTRTLRQNSLLWSLLTVVSSNIEWSIMGNPILRKFPPGDWKNIFTAAQHSQIIVPGIYGGMVALGQSTSRMSKKAMCELCEIIFAFLSERGVIPFWERKKLDFDDIAGLIETSIEGESVRVDDYWDVPF